MSGNMQRQITRQAKKDKEKRRLQEEKRKIHEKEILVPRRVHNSTIMLLRLPPELRNMIYSLCVEPKKTKLLDLCQFTDHGRRQHLEKLEYGGMPRKFIGLTQVCRQIRVEFLPYYWSRSPVADNMLDLEHYLMRRFQLRDLASGIKNSPYSGVIGVHRGCYCNTAGYVKGGKHLPGNHRNSRYSGHNGINFLAITQFNARSPCVQLFPDEFPLFAPSIPWKALFKTVSLLEIGIQLSPRYTIHFHFKESLVKGFMEKYWIGSDGRNIHAGFLGAMDWPSGADWLFPLICHFH